MNKISFTLKIVNKQNVLCSSKQFLIFSIIEYKSMNQITHQQNLSVSGILSNINKKEKQIEKTQTNKEQNTDFVFQGNTKSFLQALNKLTQQDMKEIKFCSICLIGEQIKPANPKCFFMTMIIGICLLFPFFFCCCQWWKKAVSQIFELKEDAYIGISHFLKSKSLRTVKILVYDNFLSNNKMKIIAKGVAKANIQTFIFINQAGAFDMNNSQYSNFQQNGNDFSRLQLEQWSLRWHRSKIEKQELIQ